MKVFLRRSQHTSGMLKEKVVFELDARIEPTEEEADAIYKYKLGKAVVYDSQDVEKHANNVMTNLAKESAWGNTKALISSARLALSLRCTLDSLVKGHHIECRDMEELLGAEAAILGACQTAKTFILTALTFDGREEIVDI